MTPDGAPSLKRVALGDLEHELETTRTHLSRIPSNQIDWKPHEKSWTLGELGAHIANLVGWMTRTVEGEGFDMGEPRPERSPPEGADEILESFDRAREAFARVWEEADDGTLTQPWTLRDGEREIFTMPKIAALRSFTLSHIIHHRGQLTVYLRLLDESVPAAYGPSADEEPDM